MLFGLALWNSLAFGWVVLAWIGIGQRLDFEERLAFGGLLGLGITSISYFSWVGFVGVGLGWYWVLETVLANGLLAFGVRLQQRQSPKIPYTKLGPDPNTTSLVFSLGMLAFTLGTIIYTLSNNPHGAYDAWAIWNAHARFLFHSDLQALYTPYATPHPDYPHFLSASVARLWSALGSDDLVITGCIAVFMVFACVNLLYTGVAAYTNRTRAHFAVGVVLGASHYIYASSSLMADVPLSALFLATLVCLALGMHDSGKQKAWLFCAGLFAGFATWTKNEGLLFCIVVLGIWLIWAWKTGRLVAIRQIWLPMLGGALPLIGVGVFIKMIFNLTSDLGRDLTINVLIDKLTDSSRYLIILRFYSIKLLTFGRGILPILALWVGMLGLQWSKQRIIQWISVSIPSILLVGYGFIYLITPHNLTWHLTSSLERLIVQVWPMIVFGVFLSVKSFGNKEFKKAD